MQRGTVIVWKPIVGHGYEHPFTNTLPIKRLSYEPFEQKEISVVYISAFDLAYKQVRQKYTLLESHTEKRRRLEALLAGWGKMAITRRYWPSQMYRN